MKFLEILGMIFATLLLILLIPVAIGISVKIFEIALGLFIAGVVVLTIVGLLALPLALLAIFFKWAFKKFNEV